MFSSTLSKSANQDHPGTGESGNAHGHTHNHPSLNPKFAAIGGILILNSIFAKWVFFSNEPIASTLSAVAGAIILSFPIMWSAFKDLIQGKFYMNELVAIALLAAFVIGNFLEVGVIAFFMLIAITLEERTAVGAKASIEELVKLTPLSARKICSLEGERQEFDVLVKDLSIDDVIQIRPGENFPVDGTIINGNSTVNQSSITGESFPVDKNIDDEVYAGTSNLTGLVEVKVSKVGGETTLGKVRELIQEAEKSRIPILRLIDKYVVHYTPLILMIAALVWFFSQDLMRVILILVIACPCALIVATPSAVIAAIAAAARQGILIKNISHLETISQIDQIVFDKTGTLTKGELEVVELKPAEGIELSELLYAAASAESASNHPAAEAIRRLAAEAKVIPATPNKFIEEAGKGALANCNEGIFLVGRAQWLEENGITISESLEKNTPSLGFSIIHVAREKKFLGWIRFQDAIRKEAQNTVEKLASIGVSKCSMVTGDNELAANSVAEKIGITRIEANCLPESKVQYVEKIKSSGSIVAVVGDGVNDAPALAAGNIGIAMGAIGSDIAINSASVALMNNNLMRIPFLISLSRKTRMIIHVNLIFGATIIISGILFFIFGNQLLENFANFIGAEASVTKAFFAAFIHVAGTLAVFFNSARLIRFEKNWNRLKKPKMKN